MIHSPYRGFNSRQLVGITCDIYGTLLVRGLNTLFKGALSGLRRFLATESPLKMIKNTFYFTSKALSFARYLSFCLDFLVMYRNGLIEKIRLISNVMTSQPG